VDTYAAAADFIAVEYDVVSPLTGPGWFRIEQRYLVFEGRRKGVMHGMPAVEVFVPFQ